MAYPVVQSDPTAVFGRRVVAAIIDGALVAGPAIAAVSSQYEYLDLTDGRSGTDFCDAYLEEHSGASCVNLDDTVYFNDSAIGPGSFVGLGLALLIYVILQGLTGWTPGKLLTGIRTVKADGSIVGIPKAFIRWILLIVDGQPCGLPLVGFITGLTTQGHRRVGDMAAKTYVVRSSAVGAPLAVPGVAAPPPPGGGWGAPVPAPTASWGATPPVADPTAAGWAAPSAPAPAEPAAAPVATPTSGAPAPQWDAARGTYIQWDPSQHAWLQWDEPGQQWTRIPGQ